jgi:hypothetical protein
VDSVPVPLSTVERLAAIKKRHRRAYERWTPEEDASLRQQFAAGRSIPELAGAFQRQPSAIDSRVRRLVLEIAGRVGCKRHRRRESTPGKVSATGTVSPAIAFSIAVLRCTTCSLSISRLTKREFWRTSCTDRVVRRS